MVSTTIWLLMGRIGNVIRATIYPALIFQIPLHRRTDALFKASRRMPIQFSRDLRRINRISVVVPRAVGYKFDQPPRIAAERRPLLVDQIANKLHYSNVRPFIAAADAIGFAIA